MDRPYDRWLPPIRVTTPEEDEANAVAWLTLTDRDLSERRMDRQEADAYAFETAGEGFVVGWIAENRP